MNPALKIHTTTQAPGPLNGVCQIPGSKSLTNRALVLAALASRRGPCRLNHALASEDTEVMVAGLQALGWHVDAQWNTGEITVQRSPKAPLDRLIPASQASIHVVNSGTTMRFLTGLCSLGTGCFTLDGIERMRERPLADMIEALKKLGVDVQCPMKPGCPPVVITSTGWNATEVSVGGEVSSQFVSGLLLAAPWCGKSIRIVIEGSLVSEPYVDMTIALIRQWGANVTVEAPGRYRVEPSDLAYREEYSVEPDASAASYFWGAAAITGGSITIPGLGRSSLQGDVAFVDVLEKMGCDVRFDHSGITVSGRASRGVYVDMNAITDNHARYWPHSPQGNRPDFSGGDRINTPRGAGRGKGKLAHHIPGQFEKGARSHLQRSPHGHESGTCRLADPRHRNRKPGVCQQNIPRVFHRFRRPYKAIDLKSLLFEFAFNQLTRVVADVGAAQFRYCHTLS